MPRRARRYHLACAIRRQQFRTRPDHPPTAPISTGDSVCQLASVEVTLSFREKFPIPKTAGKHEIVSRLWDGHLLSAMPQVAEELRAPLMVERYLILAKI
jgi:hypothetical protein